METPPTSTNQWTEDGQRGGVGLRTCAVAAGAGILCGAIAVLFRLALRAAANGDAFVLAAADAAPDSGWLLLVALFAVLGALAGWMTDRFAPEGAGSGIPHVKGVLQRGLVMRWQRLIPVKFVGGLSALGAGMSLGREGPTVQMGAAISEALAQRFHLTPHVRRALIAAGAGAGLTAAFNAPLAGFVFVLEELHVELGALTYATGLIATVASNLVMQVGLGARPVLDIGDVPLLPPQQLWLFACLGLLCGLLGVLFNRGIVSSLDAFGGWQNKRRWLHGTLAGVAVAVVAWGFPDAIGGGEHTAERLLSSGFSITDPLRYFALLLVLKFFLTLVCYGSGVPGGVFAPLLAIGAALGAFVGYSLEPLFPGLAIVRPLAMAGMVGTFTGSIRVPVTGIILIIEMTSSQHHLLEYTVTALAAYLVGTWLRDRPLYDALLERDRSH